MNMSKRKDREDSDDVSRVLAPSLASRMGMATLSNDDSSGADMSRVSKRVKVNAMEVERPERPITSLSLLARLEGEKQKGANSGMLQIKGVAAKNGIGETVSLSLQERLQLSGELDGVAIVGGGQPRRRMKGRR